MSTSRIEELVQDARAAFDSPPVDIEPSLDVDAADVLQLRKSCRLLQGASALLDRGFFTLVVEASLVAIERVIEFRLLETGVERPDLPGSHSGVYHAASRRGILPSAVATALQAIWREHRARTYYRDGIATRARAELVHELATETHAFVTNQSRQRYECS